jgi:DNA-binding response OmpR family regulator
MKGDEETARACACDNYVTKPYSPMQLLRVIRGLSRRIARLLCGSVFEAAC